MDRRRKGAFLVCDVCGYCCYVRGALVHAVAARPPRCPGCASPTRLARREPWRQDLRRLQRAG